MIGPLFALYCDPIPQHQVKQVFEINSPGTHEITVKVDWTKEYLQVASKDCDHHSFKLQYQRWGGKQYGVIPLNHANGVTVKVFPEGLYKMKAEPQTFPLYIVIRSRK